MSQCKCNRLEGIGDWNWDAINNTVNDISDAVGSLFGGGSRQQSNQQSNNQSQTTVPNQQQYPGGYPYYPGPARQQNSMPSWLLPAGLGLGVLLIMKNKKK